MRSKLTGLKMVAFSFPGAGDAVEDAVKGALGLGDKNKNKDKKKGGGGIFSRTGGDKDKKDTGGIFNREDKDEKERNSGFRGLFTEGPGASGDGDRVAMEAGSAERPAAESVAASDRGTKGEHFLFPLQTSNITDHKRIISLKKCLFAQNHSMTHYF